MLRLLLMTRVVAKEAARLVAKVAVRRLLALRLLALLLALMLVRLLVLRLLRTLLVLALMLGVPRVILLRARQLLAKLLPLLALMPLLQQMRLRLLRPIRLLPRIKVAARVVVRAPLHRVLPRLQRPPPPPLLPREVLNRQQPPPPLPREVLSQRHRWIQAFPQEVLLTRRRRSRLRTLLLPPRPRRARPHRMRTRL